MSEAKLWDSLARLVQCVCAIALYVRGLRGFCVCLFSYSFRAELRGNYFLLPLAQGFIFSIKFVSSEARCVGKLAHSLPKEHHHRQHC